MGHLTDQLSGNNGKPIGYFKKGNRIECYLYSETHRRIPAGAESEVDHSVLSIILQGHGNSNHLSVNRMAGKLVR
jgi:hypothetical protein